MLVRTLAPALDHAILNCILSRHEDGRISLAIAPKPTGKGDTSSLEQPILLTGTADELDAELSQGMDGALGRLIGTHVSLAEQIASQTAVLEAAKAAAKKPAPKPAAAGSSTASRPGSTAMAAKAMFDETPGNEGGDEGDDGTGIPSKLF